MGGMSSGRHGGKNTVDGYRTLDARRLQRERLLTPNRTFDWNWTRDGETVASIKVSAEPRRMVLIYRYRSHGGDWQPMEYPVTVEWTPCNYGGQRAWFLCPARGCGRRVALLYLGSASIFACRHCYRLAYQSSREPDHYRLMRRADKIRQRLGWMQGIANPKDDKPKGMHWRTFERLMDQENQLANASMLEMDRKLRKIMAKMVDSPLGGG